MRLKEMLKPKPGTLVVKHLPLTDEDRKTKEGIILLDGNETASSIYEKAEVVAVGDSFLDYKMQTEVGDTILITKAVIKRSSRFFFVGSQKFYQVIEESEYYGKL